MPLESITQFADWLSYHDSMFRGFRKWFEETEPSDAEPEKTVVDRANVWYQAFSRFDVDEIKMASYKLFGMPNSQKPQGFSQHCAAILEIAQGTRKVEEAYKPSYSRYAHRCGMCHNYGLTSVRSRGNVQFKTPSGNVIRKEFSVACKCVAGDKYRKNFHTFNATTMQTIGEISPTREECEAIIAGHREAGRHAFADRLQEFIDGKSRRVPVAVGDNA